MNDYRLPSDVRPFAYEIQLDLDLDHWTSHGVERVRVRTAKPTRTLVLHALRLDIARVLCDDQRADVSYDSDSQTIHLGLADAIAAGEHLLEIEWVGPIAERLRGLYRSVRAEERYATTQFEPANAREAFPCFDEPEFKARFTLTLTYPTGLAAISNTATAETESLPGGRTRARFGPTPPISSYLLAFTVGPYEATAETRTKRGVPIRVWTPPGLSVHAYYARDAHARALTWLEDYTGISYPYAKVDAIAVPDFASGAMENPGAITYRLPLLQVHPDNSSTDEFTHAFSVVAHELTHMWWGDLVTMAWWDDLWLNESFASFIGAKCTAALNPEWRFERRVIVENSVAFNLDSLAATHPVSADARTVDEVTQRFDFITYNKGQGVLRMIEQHVGADSFRRGVRAYLDEHRESVATANDFWRALDAASGRDVTGVANTWIKEPGHPIIHCVALERDDGLEVAIRQERFHADEQGPRTGQCWPVPMRFRYGTRDGVGEQEFLLADRGGAVRLPRASWFFPNAGGIGFYRFSLDSRSMELLRGNLRELVAEERLALLDNQWELVKWRQASLPDYFELMRALPRETDALVLGAVADALTWLDTHTGSGRRGGTEIRAIASDIFAPALERLGWDARGEDSDDDARVRAIAVRMLGIVGEDRAVRAEAEGRVTAYLAGGPALDPEMASALLAVAAVEGDLSLYDRYVGRMRGLATPQAEVERLRAALADFEDAKLVQRTVDSIFTDFFRAQDRHPMLIRLLSLRHSQRETWDMLKRQWDSHVIRMDVVGRKRMINAIGHLTPPDLAGDAVAFLNERKTAETAETIAQTVERVQLQSVAAQRLGGVVPSQPYRAGPADGGTRSSGTIH